MDTKDIFDIAANFMTVIGYAGGLVGLVLTVTSYRRNLRLERNRKEHQIFDELDNKYVEFMYKATEHPRLDLFSQPATSPRTPEELQQERALYAVLISIFERAYILFEEQSQGRQFEGWVRCMRSYCLRESFQKEWQAIGNQFDKNFQEKMALIIEEESKNSRLPHEPCN